MNQTTQTQISYKKKYRFATKKKNQICKKPKNTDLHTKKKKKKHKFAWHRWRPTEFLYDRA